MGGELARAAAARTGLLAALDLARIPVLVLILAAVVAVLAILALVLLIAVVRTVREFRAAGAGGRRVSAEKSGSHPLTTYTRNGVAGDPLNVRIIATESQLTTAFAAAGWYRADEIDFVTSLRIVFDSLFARNYPTAPISNLYLFGRRQDYAFERPGKSVRERDHIRFWKSGQRSKDGRDIWLGAATHDIAVEFSKVSHLPTHKIAPDVDAERTIVLRDLIATGWVVDQTWELSFGGPFETHNALGDPYYTDGRVAILALANVPVLLPLPLSQVRGPVAARAARAVVSGYRWVLPKSGRLRARAQRLAERAAAKVASGVKADRRDEP
jgi:LssY C-terminus